MTDTPIAATEGVLLQEVERALSQARAQNPHGDNSDEAGIWNDGFCVAWATVRAALSAVQEEGVGEAARFAADMALAAELRREAEITAECGFAWREDTPEWKAADRLEALTSWAHGPHGVRWYTDKFAEMKALASHSDASPPLDGETGPNTETGTGAADTA